MAEAPAIEVQGLYKRFAGRAGTYSVLEDIHLSIARGAFVSLVGPSGGGKSTLLNILAGLEPPDAGTVRVGGRKPGVAAGARPSVAYMHQKDLLLPWRTLWENLLLGPELKSRAHRRGLEAEAHALLDEFRLEGFAQAYPAQLSGGMRQRAALIRTLLCQEAVLLLDEPFGALDAITRTRLQGYLLRVWREYGKTVLLVTHDVEEALLLSDRVVLLSARPGRVLETIDVTAPRELRRAAPETQRLRARILDALEWNEG